jgi:hypothetical protein
MQERKFPEAWDKERVDRVISHYESQSEEETAAEDEAAWEENLLEENRRRWQENNREAIAEYNRHIKIDGVFSESLRRF